MKIYLAARYSQKNEMAEKAAQLRQRGHEITSTWINEPYPPETTMDMVPYDAMVCYAATDLEEIRKADTLVLFSVDPTIPTVRGGRHVEFGFALALRKMVVIIGPEENIFHLLPSVIQYDNWTSALKFF